MADVTGVQPAVFINHFGCFVSVLVIAGHQRFAAHEHFAVFGCFYFDTFNGLAAGTIFGFSLRRQCNNQVCFCHAVAFNNAHADRFKEL